MADMTTKILTIDLNADKAINGIINLNNAIEKNTSDMKANSAMIAENNKKMGMTGQYNANLTARLNGLTDKKDVTSKGERIDLKFEIVDGTSK